jgi:hypothetical protein
MRPMMDASAPSRALADSQRPAGTTSTGCQRGTSARPSMLLVMWQISLGLMDLSLFPAGLLSVDVDGRGVDGNYFGVGSCSPLCLRRRLRRHGKADAHSGDLPSSAGKRLPIPTLLIILNFLCPVRQVTLGAGSPSEASRHWLTVIARLSQRAPQSSHQAVPS